MIWNTIRCGVLVLLLTACGHGVQKSENTPPAQNAYHIQEVISAQGLRAWLMEDQSVPVISMRFEFLGLGAVRDPKERLGLTRLMAATMDEGAGSLDAAHFREALSAHSIDLGFSAGREHFRGHLTTLRVHRERAFELLALALTQPRFDPSPVERIKAALATRVRQQRVDPGALSQQLLWRRLWPTMSNPPGGTLATLAAITPQDLRAFHQEQLSLDRLVVGVSGAISAEELRLRLDQIFGALPPYHFGPRLLPPPLEPRWGGVVHLHQEVPQSQVLFAQPGLRREDPRFITAAVLDHITGGGGLTSRLFVEVREKRGWAYSVGTGLHLSYAAPLWMGWLGTAQVNAALALVREQWQAVAAGHITPEQVAAAKAYLIGSFPLRFTSVEGTASYLLGLQRHNLDLDHINVRRGMIEAVTHADVLALARELMDPRKLTIAVVGAQSIPGAQSVEAHELFP